MEPDSDKLDWPVCHVVHPFENASVNASALHDGQQAMTRHG